jgi:hypothetical protein
VRHKKISTPINCKVAEFAAAFCASAELAKSTSFCTQRSKKRGTKATLLVGVHKRYALQTAAQRTMPRQKLTFENALGVCNFYPPLPPGPKLRSIYFKEIKHIDACNKNTHLVTRENGRALAEKCFCTLYLLSCCLIISLN